MSTVRNCCWSLCIIPLAKDKKRKEKITLSYDNSDLKGREKNLGKKE